MKAMHRVLLSCLTGFVFQSPNALAQLKSTDIFDERPKAGGFDAESRIDAIKRERLESARQEQQQQFKQATSSRDNECLCFYPKVTHSPYEPDKNGVLRRCPHVPVLTLTTSEAIMNRTEEDRNRAFRAQQRRYQHAQEMHQVCKAWIEGGKGANEAGFRQRIGAINRRIAAEADEEQRLSAERQRARKAMKEKQAAEDADRLQRQAALRKQAYEAKLAPARRAAEQFKAEVETNRERQVAHCRAEVARLGYPDSCVCQSVLNWPRSTKKNSSCGK